jgi:hypothetical protein
MEPTHSSTRASDNVVPLALARLEKMIETRLSDAYSLGLDIEPLVRVKVLDREPGEPVDLMEFAALPADPQFYDEVVESVLASIGGLFDDEPNPGARSDDFDCDFFVGRMRCHNCRAVSQADRTSQCETFIFPHPEGRVYRVGDTVDLTPDNLPRDYYAHLNDWDGNAPLHVVEGWQCPCCNAINWAEIVIRDSVIESVWSVDLTSEVVDRVNVLSAECIEVVAAKTGQPMWKLLEKGVLSAFVEKGKKYD